MLFTTDSTSCTLGNTRIRAVEFDKADFIDLFRYWFGIGCWQCLHPDAHSDKAGDREAIRFILGFPAETAEVSLEHVLQYCEAKGLPHEVNERFNDRFDVLLESVGPGSVMNWQDFLFVPSVLKHAERLRAMRVVQTFHLHTTVPESLDRSKFGADLLRAMSEVDAVYLHTDEYIRRAERQLEAAGLRVPVMKRFDLGIDRDTMDEGLRRVNAGNFSTVIPAYSTLGDEQKQFVTEVFRSKGTVPHRFISIDRIDPVKGTATVIKAVARFLDGRRAAGETLAEMQSKYRFFFLQPFLRTPFDPRNLQTGWYGKYVHKLFQDAMERYPGIVFISDSIEGEARLLVPALLHGAHGMSGGAQDGLNLAVMESAYVNRNMDTTVISGDGAGFSIQAKSLGLAGNAFFPKAGDVNAFVQAIQDAISLEARREGILVRAKAPLVEYILRRNDSVIVDD